MADWLKKRMKVVSDGTGPGTKLYDGDGNPISLDLCQSMTWHCSREPALLTVHFLRVAVEAETNGVVIQTDDSPGVPDLPDVLRSIQDLAFEVRASLKYGLHERGHEQADALCNALQALVE